MSTQYLGNNTKYGHLSAKASDFFIYGKCPFYVTPKWYIAKILR